MELTKEKNEVKSLGLDERVAYIGDLMIKMGEDLACEAGFSGAAWEGLKGYLTCRLFNIGDLGARIVKYEDLLNPHKLEKIKSDFWELEKDLAKEAEKLLTETENPTDEELDLWTSYIEKARHNNY